MSELYINYKVKMKVEKIYVNIVKLGYMLQGLKNRQVKAWYVHGYDINPVGTI
ncbi:hypothetical protein VSK70_18995 [Bacillus sp. WOD8 KX774193]|nr:hypothetical protein [Bacillus cereus]MCC0759541.1 hypothetical protein [Bacillus sp. BRTN]MCC0769809.1 hypothetical protein [Bacillus pacificus]MDA2510681.1 hypothetical protein [Bacillus cereus]MEC3858035.1 hypothetical protein [Bacillus sp. WOD8 KX774193]